MNLTTSSVKWRPFCRGRDELSIYGMLPISNFMIMLLAYSISWSPLILTTTHRGWRVFGGSAPYLYRVWPTATSGSIYYIDFVFNSEGILIIKKRRSHGRLIIVMGVPIMIRWRLWNRPSAQTDAVSVDCYTVRVAVYLYCVSCFHPPLYLTTTTNHTWKMFFLVNPQSNPHWHRGNSYVILAIFP